MGRWLKQENVTLPRNPCSCPHPNVILSSWLSEAQRPGYDFAAPGPSSPGREQFSQVVWKATRRVAMALSEDEKILGGK